MTHEINLNNHKNVEENEKSITFKASKNDKEEEESENEVKSHSREESSSLKNNKKAMVATWS